LVDVDPVARRGLRQLTVSLHVHNVWIGAVTQELSDF